MRETKTGFGAKAAYQQEGGLEPDEDDDDEDEGDEEEEDGEIDPDDEEDEESDHNFWYALYLRALLNLSLIYLNGVYLDFQAIV